MSRLSMVVNGWDCSAAFNKWGSRFQQIKIQGPNGGVSMGGSTIVDLVKVKDFWQLEGNGVDGATYSKLLALSKSPYVSATYLHPETCQMVTRTMIPTLSQAGRTPIREGEVWYEGWTLSLEER